MQVSYFFRPIWRLWDFKGTTGRAEYFTYAVASLLVTLVLTVAVHIYAIYNWTAVMPPEMLNDIGRPVWAPRINLMAAFAVLWTVFQLPMLALTVRRLRDQHASYWALAWLGIPLLGPAVLFGYGFVPTFRDYELVLPGGTRMMRSQQLSEKRFRNILITGAVVIGGTAALSSAMSGSMAGLQIQGGKKVGVDGKMSPFKTDGSINIGTSILGGRRAHLRGGRPVKASRNRYTL